MLSVSKALSIIKGQVSALDPERIDLADSIGRFLTEHMIADRDMPPFDRSQMDGYAVIAADTERSPVRLTIIGESAAGAGYDGRIKSGETVRIMTGARVPTGADAVQKIELTDDRGFTLLDTVTILRSVKKVHSIVKKGSEIRKGRRVLAAGELITENNISVLAAFGSARPLVGKRPSIAIIGTGTEIVGIESMPGRDQIRNSNSVMLRSLAEAAGAEATIFPNVGDDIKELKRTIRTAAKGRDILIVTGGVSVGKYDLTKPALTELGAEIFFDKLNLKPGKPTVFARLGKTLIFALPGNPVAAAVTFNLFVRKAILKLQGAAGTDLIGGNAVAAADIRAAKDRRTLIPSTLSTGSSGELIAAPIPSHGSSDLVSFARAKCLIDLAAGSRTKSGTVVKILFL